VSSRGGCAPRGGQAAGEGAPATGEGEQQGRTAAGAEAHVVGRAQAQVRAAAFLLFSRAQAIPFLFHFPTRARERFHFLCALSFPAPGLLGDAFRAKAVLGDAILTCSMAAMTPELCLSLDAKATP
jgi:hypothetical protein